MNPLEQLKDIHLPPEIGIWPLAIGWWILIVLAALVIILMVFAVYRHRQRSKPKRLAQALLLSINADSPGWPAQLNQLMKRAALSYFPQQDVAGLHSVAWKNFLLTLLKNKYHSQFEAGFELLQQNLYRQHSQDNFKSCYQTVELWLDNALPPNKSHLKGRNNV